MVWRDLIETQDETLVSPWVGGRSLRHGPRVWKIHGTLPEETGWYRFRLTGRSAEVDNAVDPAPERLEQTVTGYLVGDRLVKEDARVPQDPSGIAKETERVHLIERGVDRFARIAAGRFTEQGPLVFKEEEMPLGPEEAVLSAYLDGAVSTQKIADVPPALDAAFRMEVWRKQEAERRRLELERQRKEAEERRRQDEIRKTVGDGIGRRRVARFDFEAAARAALRVGDAEYLDSRDSRAKGEMVVRFRLDRRRYECVCDKHTLRIIDSGICLVDHHSGEQGDRRFTLESLPGVIRQADRQGELVVFRHIED